MVKTQTDNIDINIDDLLDDINLSSDGSDNFSNKENKEKQKEQKKELKKSIKKDIKKKIKNEPEEIKEDFNFDDFDLNNDDIDLSKKDQKKIVNVKKKKIDKKNEKKIENIVEDNMSEEFDFNNINENNDIKNDINLNIQEEDIQNENNINETNNTVDNLLASNIDDDFFNIDDEDINENNMMENIVEEIKDMENIDDIKEIENFNKLEDINDSEDIDNFKELEGEEIIEEENNNLDIKNMNMKDDNIDDFFITEDKDEEFENIDTEKNDTKKKIEEINFKNDENFEDQFSIDDKIDDDFFSSDITNKNIEENIKTEIINDNIQENKVFEENKLENNDDAFFIQEETNNPIIKTNDFDFQKAPINKPNNIKKYIILSIIFIWIVWWLYYYLNSTWMLDNLLWKNNSNNQQNNWSWSNINITEETIKNTSVQEDPLKLIWLKAESLFPFYALSNKKFNTLWEFVNSAFAGNEKLITSYNNLNDNTLKNYWILSLTHTPKELSADEITKLMALDGEKGENAYKIIKLFAEIHLSKKLDDSIPKETIISSINKRLKESQPFLKEINNQILLTANKINKANYIILYDKDKKEPISFKEYLVAKRNTLQQVIWIDNIWYMDSFMALEERDNYNYQQEKVLIEQIIKSLMNTPWFQSLKGKSMQDINSSLSSNEQLKNNVELYNTFMFYYRYIEFQINI